MIITGRSVPVVTPKESVVYAAGKRVSFGNQLSPELFDKSLPPITPVRRGTTPRHNTPQAARPLLKRHSFASVTTAHATIFEEEQLGSPASKKSPKISGKKSPAKLSPKVTPKKSPKVTPAKVTPKVIVKKSPNVTPKKSPKVTPAKVTPKVIVKKSPKVTPKKSSKVTPAKVTPKQSPKVTPKKTPVKSPKSASKKVLDLSPVRQPSSRKSTSPFKQYPASTPKSGRKSLLNLTGLAELMTSPPTPEYRRVDTPRPPRQKSRSISKTPGKPTPGKAAALKAIYGKVALKVTMKKTPQRSRVATPAGRKSTKKLWSDIVKTGVVVKGVGPVKAAPAKQRGLVVKKKVARKVHVSRHRNVRSLNITLCSW